ncbi:MAG: hypothetical protein JXP34_20410 [Planctomycetes bacterium]|nr:hypothetical protein [Planctomycetota bacterium]
MDFLLQRRSFAPAIVLIAACGLASGQNETPKKKTAFIFAPHPSGQTYDERVEQWLGAENYAVTKYVWGRGGTAPSLERLKAIAGSGFAVLHIHTHGSPGGITIEDFATRDAANQALNAYKAADAYKDLKDDISLGVVHDPRPADTRHAIGISAAGIRKLFGGTDANRSIVVITGCNSWALQNGNTPKPFGATEYLGLDGLANNRAVAGGLTGFAFMGGMGGIPKRPVAPAFAGRMNHMGPGNTTLAPSITSHEPANDTVFAVPSAFDGKTVYETKMRRSPAEIMTVTGCGAVLSNQRWTSVTEHQFHVQISNAGRLILRVRPTLAVSENNENWLIGNLYREGDVFADPEEEERVEVNECQFGQSGLDGLKPYVPPENPYRWCVWCGERPKQPTGTIRPPQNMEGDPSPPRTVAWGEQDAFVLYQDDPGPGTVFLSTPRPPNLILEQVGDWYAHVIFVPEAAQAGESIAVTFTTEDDGGLRAQREIQWEVVERVDRLVAYDPFDRRSDELGSVVVRPGESGEYTFSIANSGNTDLDDITLIPMAVEGPADIPPDAVDVEPRLLGLLRSRESVQVRLVVPTTPANPPGTYLGTLAMEAISATGPYAATGLFHLILNEAPVIEGPGGPVSVRAGEPALAEMTALDPEGDPLSVFLSVAPVDATLAVDGPNVSFAWPTGADDQGSWVIPVIADDGIEATEFDLRIDVGPPPDRPFLRGNANADGRLDLGDAIFVLQWQFQDGDAPPCLDAADVNDDGRVDLADAIFLLSYIFADGAPPAEPFDACGADPSDDDLGCASFSPCE